MADLAPDQRNNFYLIAAGRVGIHKSILYALRFVQARPELTDGEKGLGLTPAHSGSESQFDTFPEQVQYAANTLRSLTNQLVDEGWTGPDFWDGRAGRYADKFINRIAQGYQPKRDDHISGALAPCNSAELRRRYIEDLSVDYSGDQLPESLAYLDPALIEFAERVPRFYQKVTHQREALLEAVRLWRQLNTHDEAIRSLLNNGSDDFDITSEEGLVDLDRALSRFAANMATFFAGYPHQREALLRLAHLWRQLPSREDAIASLEKDTSPETDLKILDPALIAFIKRIPNYYQGRGDQRNAITEGYRLWNNIPSRKQALMDLGIQQDLFAAPLDPETAKEVGRQLDQELVDFVKRVPRIFNETDPQREGMLRMIQLWRRLAARDTAIQSVMDDLKEMENPRSTSITLVPQPMTLPTRPSRWTPRNIQLSASIIPNGNFTWSEATRAGQRMPPDQATVDAMIRLATLAQRARNQIGRPFRITSWYRPPAINRAVGGSTYSRHIVGDAMDYYVDGLTGYDLYRALNPWWPGGLGLYGGNRYLISHIDARNYRARWNHR